MEQETSKSFVKRNETLGKNDEATALIRQESMPKVKETERLEYSISNEQVQGFFKNFFIQLWALFAKRFH